MCLFQSTHPRRVRHALRLHNIRLCVFQSTHPRRVRHDMDEFFNIESWFQSTHPRRVRHHGGLLPCREHRFNPRTHVGCDQAAVTTLLCHTSFNPRTHVGCDRASPCSRGSTPLFQSTHPRRVRQRKSVNKSHPKEFQSTHPRRVRPLARSFRCVGSGFNPRTHVGCDSAGM